MFVLYKKRINSYITDLSLDAMDSAGEQHLHIEHNIFKRRLDLEGKPIEDPKKEESKCLFDLLE